VRRAATTALVLAWASAAAADGLDDWTRDLAGLDEGRVDEAARRLGESADPRALEVLLDALAAGAPPRTQAALLGALAPKHDARALDVLAHFARNRNPELRKKAVLALAEIGDARAVVPLEAALSDGVGEVRAAAALALGKRKERSAEPKLIRLLERRDAAAAPALAALGTPELAHRLSEMFGRVPDELLCAALGAMLKRPDFGPDPIRLEVVHTLSKVPGIDSTTALLEYVAATEKDKARPSRVEAQRIVEQRSGR
jgi:hypothetical protein